MIEELKAFLKTYDETDWCQRLKYDKCTKRACLIDENAPLPQFPTSLDKASCERYRLELAIKKVESNE
jgi:hypothetical protein